MPRTVHADPPRSDFDKKHGLLAYAVIRKITFYRLLSFTPRFLRISFLLAVKIISEFRFSGLAFPSFHNTVASSIIFSRGFCRPKTTIRASFVLFGVD